MHSRTEAYRTEIISDCPILLLKYDQTSYPLESYERESVPLPGSRAYRKLRMMSAKVKAAEVFVGWKRTGLSILVVEASKHVVPFRVVLLALLSPSLNDSHPLSSLMLRPNLVSILYSRVRISLVLPSNCLQLKYTSRRPWHCFLFA